jgi:muconolactone delta-isomerase
LVLLVLGVIRLPSFKTLGAGQKAEIAAIEAEIKQVEQELQACPGQQQKLLRQIGDEGQSAFFEASRNKELQQKFEDSVRLELQLTERRADLQRRRNAIAKGTRKAEAFN